VRDLGQELSPGDTAIGIGTMVGDEQTPVLPGFASPRVRSCHQLTACGKMEAAGIAPATLFTGFHLPFHTRDANLFRTFWSDWSCFMTAIGVYDAKTQLPKLLERVSRGERFVITKHGPPVAQLVPAVVEAAVTVKGIIREMEEWQEREGPTLGPGQSSRELREEGRRF
jgi:prevent-host-death family protein